MPEVHQILLVATDVTCQVVSLFVCRSHRLADMPSKMAEPIEMPFGADLGGPGNHVLFGAFVHKNG